MRTTSDWALPGYQIGEQIAAGGMSDVYLAERSSDASPVVVKIARQAADQKTLQRLSKEHRLLLKIDHPHVQGTGPRVHLRSAVPHIGVPSWPFASRSDAAGPTAGSEVGHVDSESIE